MMRGKKDNVGEALNFYFKAERMDTTERLCNDKKLAGLKFTIVMDVDEFRGKFCKENQRADPKGDRKYGKLMLYLIDKLQERLPPKEVEPEYREPKFRFLSELPEEAAPDMEKPANRRLWRIVNS